MLILLRMLIRSQFIKVYTHACVLQPMLHVYKQIHISEVLDYLCQTLFQESVKRSSSFFMPFLRKTLHPIDQGIEVDFGV